MPTAIFDVDGTLTDTNRVDEECYLAAVFAVLGREVGPNWGGVEDVTDAGILRAAWARHFDGPLPDDVERSVIARFLRLLGHEASRRPDRFRPVPGARHVFTVVRGLGWSPAIATGGWRDSARLKLDAAGVSFDQVPLATSSDHLSRVDIIRSVWPDADRLEPEDAVYFGDGVWDVRATERLGLRFVGVGSAQVAARLQGAGASVVLEDFTDHAKIGELLVETVRSRGDLMPRG